MSSCSDEDVEIDPPAIDSDEDEQTTNQNPNPSLLKSHGKKEPSTLHNVQTCNEVGRWLF